MSASREATPSPSPRRSPLANGSATKPIHLPGVGPKQSLWKKILTSPITIASWIFFIVAVLLAAIKDAVPQSYCTRDVKADCRKCPVHAICSVHSFKCDGESHLVKGVCIAPDSDEEAALKIAETLETSNLTTFSELKETLGDAASSKQIRIALGFAGYEIIGDSITPVLSGTRKIAFFSTALLFFGTLLGVSLFLRVRN